MVRPMQALRALYFALFSVGWTITRAKVSHIDDFSIVILLAR